MWVSASKNILSSIVLGISAAGAAERFINEPIAIIRERRHIKNFEDFFFKVKNIKISPSYIVFVVNAAGYFKGL